LGASSATALMQLMRASSLESGRQLSGAWPKPDSLPHRRPVWYPGSRPLWCV